MGKVYAPPDGFTPPAFGQNVQEYSKKCDEYVEKLKKWAKENGTCPEAGKEIRFQVADGYACYIVVSLKPVALIHVDTLDAYQYQYAHRLTAKDVREEVRKLEAINKLFSKETK